MYPGPSFVLALLAVLVLAPFIAYVQYSRNAAVKRKLAPMLSAASTVVAGLVVHALSGSVALAVVVGAAGLVYRRAKPGPPWFCARCGRTTMRNRLVPAGSHCPYCGARLDASDGLP